MPYRLVVRPATVMFNAFTGAPISPPLVAIALAFNDSAPRVDGRHEQLTAWLEPEPVVGRFLHPGIVFPFAINVTFEL